MKKGGDEKGEGGDERERKGRHETERKNWDEG